jgi:hypothetical protein
MNNKSEMRAASEERPPTYKGLIDNNSKLSGNVMKISNYDNNQYVGNSSSVNSPLISRKSSQNSGNNTNNNNKFWSKSQSSTPQHMKQKQFNTIASNSSREKSPFLYDRRLNKSFETPNGLLCDNVMRCQNERSAKNTLFRRSSTPQLNSIYYDSNPRDSISSSWCCGNFVLKQWKKMHQHY